MNGLRSDISDALKQRSDITDMKSMITWARKLESIYYKHKTDSPILASMETSLIRDGVHDTRRRIEYYTSNGNHQQRSCEQFEHQKHRNEYAPQQTKVFTPSQDNKFLRGDGPQNNFHRSSDHETEMNAYETDQENF